MKKISVFPSLLEVSAAMACFLCFFTAADIFAGDEAEATIPNGDIKLMGYAGLEIGAFTYSAISIINNNLNKTDYRNVELVKLTAPSKQIKDYRDWVEASLRSESSNNDFLYECLLDLEFASGGIVLAPPWEAALVFPRDGESSQPTLRNVDIFFFQDDKLVACLRYPNVKPAPGKYYPGSGAFQQLRQNAVFYTALLEKYGTPTSVDAAILVTNPNSMGIGKYFRMGWGEESSQQIGSMFAFEGAQYTPKSGPQPLGPILSKFQGRKNIYNRGALMPIDMQEIAYRNPAHEDRPIALVCTAYYSDATRRIMYAANEAFQAQQLNFSQQEKDETVRAAKEQL